MAVTAREVIFRILGDTDEFVEGYTEANRALDDFEKKTKKTGKLLSDIAKKSAAVTAAVMAAGAALGKIAADFNAALAPIETLIPGQTARVNELKSAIQDLSPAVRKTTDDLASGAYNIISAYGDAGDTVSKLEISAKTASAGMAGTNDAINLLSAVTKAYGDTSAAAQRQVADLAFVTLRNGQTSFPELAASIQRVTSLSSTLKISQKELFAVFAAGTGVIGGAAEVATKTAAAQAELLRGTDTLNAAFRELGVSSGTGLIEKFGGFQGALRALKDYADDTGVSITNLFGSVQAGQIALYLTGEGAEKFTRDLSDMQSAAGAMETAFDAATGGVNKFADGITQSKLNVTVFAQKLGDEVLASSRGFLDAVLSVTGALADMDRGTLETIVSVGKVVAVAAATTAALAGLSKGILAARAATIALTGAMAANPVGLAIVALTAGIVAFIEISKRLENSYQSQIDAGRRAAKQLDDERLAHQKNAQEYKNRSDNLGDLIKKYEDLSKEAADDARAQAELQAVVKRIGTIAPEAITEWNSYGDALSVNAEKAKEARDILAAIAKQELELSILKGGHLEAELQYESTTIKKWLDSNSDAILQNDIVNKKVYLQGLFDYYNEFFLELDKIDDFEERNSAQEKALSDLKRAISELGIEAKTSHAGVLGAMALLKNAKNEAGEAEKAWDQLIAKRDRLLEIRKQLGTLQSDRAQLDLLNTPAETPGPTESDEPGPVKPAGDDKTQGRRLRELDDSYRIQKEMAARNGEDLLAIDAEWQAKRLALLETFIQEDVAARKEGVSWAAALDASLRSALAEGYGQISEQLDAVRTRLAELSSEQAVLSIDAAVSFADQHGVPLDEALKKIAEEARKAAGEELSNTEKLVREQDALNIKLEEGNVSGETAVSIRGRLAAVTGELAAADTRRQEALAREEEASRRLLAFDLDRISTTAQKTIDAVDKEIGAKKELGLFGKTEKETEKNALQERYNSLLEKQKALEEEYVRLRKSESPDDQARADALKGQIQEVAAETEAAGKEIQSSAESVAGAIAEKFSRIAGIIRDTVRGIADIAGGLIDNQAERDAQAAAERLAAIEQQKNATLNELDGELNDMREEHRRENEEREAEYQERMYEAQQGQYSRTIAELQGAFAMETNIEKLRELEKQLEAEKKKKREAAEQKKKEQEDKKRAEDQLRQENEALNKRNQLEWEFSAAQVTTENAAGAAAAEAARQKARWEKASTITTLSLQAAESVVKAAVAIAGMDYIGAAAYTLAAGIATGQAAVAGLAPEPASYIPQPLPPPPRKLAAGGIFMPSIGGMDIITAGGSHAVIAEANIPELYLPVTAENIDSLFKAAGVKNYREDSIVYAPVFDITLNNTENMTAEDLVDYLKNEWERDFVEFAEGAYKKYFVGTRT